MKTGPILEVEDLKTWFAVKRGIFSRTVGYVKAVDGISLTVEKGEILGLVGESGCGKTTLGRTLVGMEKAREGIVRFMGKPLFSLSQREMIGLRRRLNIIFQDPLASLNPRMNALDIVTEGLVKFHMVEGARADHGLRLLREVGLDGDALFRYPHEFSGGQRQRICIARAISLRPNFIVCDEPVSALDVSVQAQVLNLLLHLKESYDLSYLFISHDLSVVYAIADRVAVMYLGKIVEQGPAEETILDPMHPYTRALVSAVPTPGVKKKEKIILQGEIPSPSSPPEGCRFHTRCPKVMAICEKEVPAETNLGARRIWCHLFSRGARSKE